MREGDQMQQNGVRKKKRARTCRGCDSIPLANALVKAQMREYGARFEQMPPGGGKRKERGDEEMK
jgi:hypothetical protein